MAGEPSNTTLQVTAVANAIQALGQTIAHELQVAQANRTTAAGVAAQARAEEARLQLQLKQLEYTNLTGQTAPTPNTPTPNTNPPNAGVGSSVPGSVTIFGAEVPIWALALTGVVMVGGVGYYGYTRMRGASRSGSKGRHAARAKK